MLPLHATANLWPEFRKSRPPFSTTIASLTIARYHPGWCEIRESDILVTWCGSETLERRERFGER
ncbi:hypothetical protein BC938DRAFT_477492 [Jimgerdemannia flammicorona]|uniref:Uncharacterized protein n=1 Tax=Jimgerdemannia flammicorona TaxID=994334 RepID=A0A433QP79_9FUNG|nr:hypothetical protein BC938DRAFT_477492 [Jimgerdemannia flammicorona]